MRAQSVRLRVILNQPKQICVVLLAGQRITLPPLVVVDVQELLVDLLVGGIARQARFELGDVFCWGGGAARELGILFNDLLLQMSSRAEISKRWKTGQKSDAEEARAGFQARSSG